MEQQKRKRVNAKQTAKGEWYFDVTVEMTGGDEFSSIYVATQLLELAKTTEQIFRDDGKKLVG